MSRCPSRNWPGHLQLTVAVVGDEMAWMVWRVCVCLCVCGGGGGGRDLHKGRNPPVTWPCCAVWSLSERHAQAPLTPLTNSARGCISLVTGQSETRISFFNFSSIKGF